VCPAAILDRSVKGGPLEDFETCLLRHGRRLDVGIPDRHAHSLLGTRRERECTQTLGVQPLSSIVCTR